MGEAANIRYRKAGVEDVQSLADIRCEFLQEANGTSLDAKAAAEIKKACLEYFDRAVPDGSFIAWLAEDAGRIIATSGICFYEIPPNKSCPNGKTAYIQNMYTKTEYRRRGIAKLLFKKMMEEAKARGCSKVLLYATDMGRPIYEKFGFKDTKGDMVYYL